MSSRNGEKAKNKRTKLKWHYGKYKYNHLLKLNSKKENNCMN